MDSNLSPRLRMAALVAYLAEAPEANVIYLDALYDGSGKNADGSDEWTVRQEVAELADTAKRTLSR